MLFHSISSHITLTSLLLLQAGLYIPASAYKPLSDTFLHSIKAEAADFDAQNGRLLAPILTPRSAGSPGHANVQRHFVNYFQSELPRWSIEWHNTTILSQDEEADLATLVARREPPWTKPGQANFLTFAAHYDTHEANGKDPTAAAPCAVLMHMAKSIDPYMTQMYDEMVAIGEGGDPDIQMDMGVQVVLFDGREAMTRTGRAPSLYGSRYVSNTCWIVRLTDRSLTFSTRVVLWQNHSKLNATPWSPTIQTPWHRYECSYSSTSLDLPIRRYRRIAHPLVGFTLRWR